MQPNPVWREEGKAGGYQLVRSATKKNPNPHNAQRANDKRDGGRAKTHPTGVESLGTGVRPVCASEESTHDSEPVKPRMLRLKVQLDHEGKLTQERQHKINT